MLIFKFCKNTIIYAIFIMSIGMAYAEENLQIAQGNYYVIGRYYCVSTSDSSDSGSCDIQTNANSCSEAYDAQRRDVQSRGDPCRRCLQNQVDNTKRWSQRMDWIHGGACQ